MLVVTETKKVYGACRLIYWKSIAKCSFTSRNHSCAVSLLSYLESAHS
jgi:hypothetical protein